MVSGMHDLTPWDNPAIQLLSHVLPLWSPQSDVSEKEAERKAHQQHRGRGKERPDARALHKQRLKEEAGKVRGGRRKEEGRVYMREKGREEGSVKGEEGRVSGGRRERGESEGRRGESEGRRGESEGRRGGEESLLTWLSLQKLLKVLKKKGEGEGEGPKKASHVLDRFR